MIKIYNQTENHVEETNFWHMLDVFGFLAEHEYGKEDVLVVYHQDEDGKQTDLLKIGEAQLAV